MPTAEVDTKRKKFEDEIVTPHIASCLVCQSALAEVNGLRAGFLSEEPVEISLEFSVEEVDVSKLDPAEEAEIDKGWDEYERGIYYTLDQATCSVKCAILHQLFKDYFVTL